MASETCYGNRVNGGRRRWGMAISRIGWRLLPFTISTKSSLLQVSNTSLLRHVVVCGFSLLSPSQTISAIGLGNLADCAMRRARRWASHLNCQHRNKVPRRNQKYTCSLVMNEPRTHLFVLPCEALEVSSLHTLGTDPPQLFRIPQSLTTLCTLTCLWIILIRVQLDVDLVKL